MMMQEKDRPEESSINISGEKNIDDDNHCDGDESESCCQKSCSCIKWVLFDIKWGYVVYHVGLLILSLFILTKSIVLFFKDPFADAFITRLYTGLFGKLI